MLEPITTNLVASGIAKGGSIAAAKTRKILRRERFSDEIDDLTTEFTSALKNSLKTAIDEADRDDIADLEANWTTIAEELENVDVGFADEQEGIVEITDAIAAGLEIDLDANPQLRESLEAAVAEAAQETVRSFAERIAGTDLADVFLTETSIEVVDRLEDVDDNLTSIQRRLRRHEIAALRNAGFVRLDPLYFQRHEPGDPETAWRTGFDLVEVQAGYPLPRERRATGENDEREPVKTEIDERLDAGENLVVLGEGGSGKSTVCKRVACEWHDEGRGPVFYRGSKATAAFDEPGELIEAIRASEGEVLVVVEDAASGDAEAIWEVLDTFEDADTVSFLLDSRRSAWRDGNEAISEARLDRHRQQVGIVEMPALDDVECERAVEHYEDLTGADVPHEGEQLYEEVRSADVGGSLLLAYRLTGPPVETDDEHVVSALHADVRGAYEAVVEWADSEEFPQTVAVMVNVLNAAGLPVAEALVHGLAQDRDDHRAIDRTLGFLEGTMLEPGPEEVRTPHQEWSALYLERMLEDAGERLARDLFEECVDALFRLVDEEARRERVEEWLRAEPAVLAAIAAEPEEEAGRFVRRIAEIGEPRLRLGTLLGTPETWRVELPDACPLAARVDWFDSRGTTHRKRGELEAAVAENERLQVVTESNQADEADVRQWQAWALTNLGVVAHERGDLDGAEEYYEESLAVKRDIGDRPGAAQNLNNLGVVAQERGDLDDAEQYHEESLAIKRDIGDRRSAGNSLLNFGVVAQKRGDLDDAEEYYEESLAIFRDVGDRHGAASSLGSLGLIARKIGDLDDAEQYHEESLAITRDIGDRGSAGNSLHNLGMVAQKRGDLDDADEYYEESLAIFRDVGDRPGAAKSLHNLGLVARNRGTLDDAEEYHEEAARILLDIGASRDALPVLKNLVHVTEQQGKVDAAIEWCEQGTALAQDLGDNDWLDYFWDRRAALCEED